MDNELKSQHVVNTPNRRNESIDLVGGMIIYMIFGHIISWTNLNNSIYYISLDRIFNFFMPWFFFKSGMFYNGKNASQQWKKFFIPFILWGIMGLLTYYLRDISSLGLSRLILQPAKTLLLSGIFEGNIALWFLLSLFLVRWVYPVLLKFLKNWHIIALSGLLTIVLLELKQYIHITYTYPEYFYNSLVGLFFYALGVEMRENQYNNKVLAVSALLFVALSIHMPSRVSFYHTKLIEGNALLWIISSSAGIFLFNGIANRISNYANIPCRVLTYIGKNSMIFFVSHFIVGNVFYIVLAYMNLLPVNSWLLF